MLVILKHIYGLIGGLQKKEIWNHQPYFTLLTTNSMGYISQVVLIMAFMIETPLIIKNVIML